MTAIPTIALTMGDPAGIGPEVLMKALEADRSRHGSAYRPLIIGDMATLEQARELTGAAFHLRSVETPDEQFPAGLMPVLQPDGLDPGEVILARVSPEYGRAAAVCLEEAFRWAQAGLVQGVVSAPMNKAAFHLAGYRYADELEYVADLTGSADTYHLAPLGPAWTVRVTEHVPFRDIADLITRERVLWYILRLHETLTALGTESPRIGVAALNVHAGEGGQVGREEADEIEPAVRDAQEQGLKVTGPIPADVIFAQALASRLDGVVAMYHDQANIPRKLQPLGNGATLFMGLPVPYGTTAHGTAFDIAGQGIADPGSMLAALGHVVRLADTEAAR